MKARPFPTSFGRKSRPLIPYFMTYSLLLLVFLLQSAFSQEVSYRTIPAIAYYPAEEQPVDAYRQQQCVLDLYVPENTTGFATLVWFHGGGLTGGHREIPEALKNKGIAVAGVGYRLSPQVSSPAYIRDAAEAIAWVFSNIAGYRGDTSLLFLSGHSAGGYLAAMTGLDKRWLGERGIDANRIAGIIPFSAQTITHFTIRKEKGIKETVPVVDSLAPLFHVRADAPPLLLITGDRELELWGRYDENAYLMRMMKVAGHKETRLLELQGYDHGMTYPAFPLLLDEIKRITSRSRVGNSRQ